MDFRGNGCTFREGGNSFKIVFVVVVVVVVVFVVIIVVVVVFVCVYVCVCVFEKFFRFKVDDFSEGTVGAQSQTVIHKVAPSHIPPTQRPWWKVYQVYPIPLTVNIFD